MAYTFAICPADRVGVVRLTGRVEGRAILAAARELAAHPDWRPGFRAVWDASRMGSLDVSLSDVAALVRQERQLQARGEVGDLVVVARDSIWLSLVRLFDRRMGPDGRTLWTVPTPQDALSLLGIDALPPADREAAQRPRQPSGRPRSGSPK